MSLSSGRLDRKVVRVSSIALLLLSLLAILSCCALAETSLEVTIINNTQNPLDLRQVGGVVRLDQEVVLAPNDRKILTSSRLGYTTFQISYLGLIYEGDSGNSDDYNEYHIVFKEASGSLSCRFIVPGYRDREIALSMVE